MSLRLSRRTQSELQLYMWSWPLLANETAYIYWSKGILYDTKRIEWWVVYTNDQTFRFVSYTVDPITKTRTQHSDHSESTFQALESFIRTQDHFAYSLFRLDTDLV